MQNFTLKFQWIAETEKATRNLPVSDAYCRQHSNNHQHKKFSSERNGQRWYPNWRRLLTWRGNICIQGMLGCIQYMIWRRNSCCRT